MNNKSFIVLKIEKLARALYLITDFMPDREPLKWQLRRLALKTLVNLNNNEGGFNYFSSLLKNSQEIISLVDLALATNNVSQMNFALLRKEYAQVINLIQTDGPKQLHQGLRVDQLPAENQTTLPQPVLETVIKPEVNGINDSLLDKGQRQDKILSHIRGKGWLSIKDIANAVPSFSTKTVQRELSELVDKGVLKKKGERRWSRYTLNSLTN